MASTVLDPIAEALAGLASQITVNGTTLKGYYPTRVDLPKLPCLVVSLPTIDRREIDEPETQLGAHDWRLEFTAWIFFDLGDPLASQARLTEAVEQFISLVDHNETLNSLVQDAVVTTADLMTIERDNARTVIGYETTVNVWTLVH